MYKKSYIVIVGDRRSISNFKEELRFSEELGSVFNSHEYIYVRTDGARLVSIKKLPIREYTILSSLSLMEKTFGRISTLNFIKNLEAGLALCGITMKENILLEIKNANE